MKRKRVERLRDYMEREGIDATILIDSENQYYFTGFQTVVYSRPVITLIFHDYMEMIVPELEKLHAEEAKVDALFTYGETPTSRKKPYDILKRRLYNVSGKIGVEMNHVPLSLYNSLLCRYKLEDISPEIQKMRMIKDNEELQVIRNAAHLVDTGVSESIEAAEEGVREIELDSIGNDAILRESASLFSGYRISLFSMSPSGAERTALPHVFSTGRALKKGDVVIHSRQVSLNGYRAECERTFFLSPPRKEYRTLFEIMLNAQSVAMDEIRDGVPASQIDSMAREIITKAGYGKYFPHRTGHGLGISVHEPPFLRFDSSTVLRENMVVTVEPGIYIPGLGGFRHSDTIIVRKSGGEVITRVPRELDFLVR